MNRWYRAYVGTCSDPKIAAIAFQTKISKCKVIAVWHFILELCANANSGGKFQLDAGLICGTLDVTVDEVRDIWAGMIIREMVTDNEVLAWKKRQYETDKTDPTNAERQRRWKQKHLGNGQVTEQKRPETETETETEKKESKTGKKILPDNWEPSASHYDLAKKKGLPMESVAEAADEMRAWSLGNGERRANWDWVFNNWLRRNAAKRSGNGYRGSGALQDDSRSASRAAARLAEKAERGEFSFGPRPGLLPASDGNNVVMLPKGRDSQS